MGEVLTLTCAVCGSEFEWVVKASRPRKYCSERCRKSQYDKACSDCGARIDGTTPGGASGRCRVCAGAERSRRARERHIDAIQRWATLHGEPPSSADWCWQNARFKLKDEGRALRAEAALREGWPSSQGVIAAFGSWNAAIEAAGFRPRAPHGGGGNERRRRAFVA